VQLTGDLLTLVALVLVGFLLPIVLVALLFRWWARPGRGTRPALDERATIRERLARGEITPEEAEAAFAALGYPERPPEPPAT
jgi:uncharacterized membrane protein